MRLLTITFINSLSRIFHCTWHYCHRQRLTFNIIPINVYDYSQHKNIHIPFIPIYYYKHTMYKIQTIQLPHYNIYSNREFTPRLQQIIILRTYNLNQFSKSCCWHFQFSSLIWSLLLCRFSALYCSNAWFSSFYVSTHTPSQKHLEYIMYLPGKYVMFALLFSIALSL